jgi:glycosyltransferase involved in cell wall biosynthesis
MPKKKVLHLWQSNYPWEVRIGKINRSLIRSDYDVTVMARGSYTDPEYEELETGEKIIRVNPWTRSRTNVVTLPVPYNPMWMSALKKAMYRVDYDAVVIRDIPLFECVSALRRNRPIILDMAEHYPAAMRTWDKYKKSAIGRLIVHRLKIPDLLERRAVLRADAITVVCDEQKARLIEQYNVSSDKIFVVKNTPELMSSVMKADLVASTNNSRQDTYCFGYHGILCADRDLDTIIKGFEIAASKDNSLRLLLAGGGESEPHLKNLVSKMLSKDLIEFTGRYSPEALPALYKRANCGIVSLLENEFTQHTVANKFFDYPGRGLPFIYTNLKPLRHLAASMPSAFSFEPGSAESVADTMLKVKQLSQSDPSALIDATMQSKKRIYDQYNWSQDEKQLLAALDFCVRN